VSQQLRTLHILLVDGDSYTREKIRQVLSKDVILYSALSCNEAGYILQRNAIDVLVSEVVLPDASGLDLCHMVRRSATLHPLSIMLLTTLSTLNDKISGFQAGADDYVVKPFDARHLMARIRLLSRIKRLEYGNN
jgi:DNA-binding response OmpR family regulator